MPHQCTNCGRTFPDGSKEMLSGCPDCGGNKFQFEPAGRSDESTSNIPDDHEPPDSSSSVANTVSQATRTVRDWVSSDESPTSSDRADKTGTRSNAPASNTSESSDASDPEPEQAADTRRTDAQPPTSASREAASNTSTANDSRPDLGQESSTEWPDHGFEDPYRDRSSPDPPESKEWPDVGQRPDHNQPDRSDRDDAAGKTPVDTEDTAQASARSDVVSPDELPDDPPTQSVEDNQQPQHDTPAGQGAPDASEGRIAGTPDNDSDNPDLEALRAELNQQFESIKIVRPGEYELNLMELYDREEYIVSLMEDGRYAIEVPDAWRGDEDR
ncbi:OapC/ArvC family zinc-ribbon domain-containing protein [Natranaeroarchaeum sulfidigenes]|uniref:Zn-ribbon containing protein n=1 Tax=Natranaeroarchaeum sulfidigenes TaxID=2784880 RepID=A0A897MVQ7_9EURY|nr:Zn-ribbon containing protein [Natranaeroarchaeum sulfidigenes]QSG04361.1 Zn-ribbon containing protein [Natranaeroarchaeum sulfidigenes]